MTRRLQRFRQVLEGARALRGVALMGVCNVTPDSFSDGGRYLGAEASRARVDELLAEGADLVDVGGESTRPRAAPVAAHEQLGRVLEVVRYAAEKGACVTIDTTNAEVAAACLDAGACAINDVSCLRDPELARVAAASGAAMVLMHARGTQEEMRGFSAYPDDAYGDVVDDVLREWEHAASRAREAGLAHEAIVMDPGLGFAKNARQSFELLRRTAEIVKRVDVPVVIGASRKSFLAVADRESSPTERLGASLAAALHAYANGAALLRIHDVRATAQAIDLAKRLAGRGPVQIARAHSSPSSESEPVQIARAHSSPSSESGP